MSSGAAVILRPLNGQDTIGAEYRFQCAPLEEFAVEVAYEHTDFMTVGAGEFSRPQGQKLRTVSFDTLIVPDQPNWAQFPVSDVESLAKDLLTICQSGKPFTLTIAGIPDDGTTMLSMYATMRTVRFSDKAGEPGTKYVSVSFSEYRAPNLTDDGQDARPGDGTKDRVPNKIWLEYTKKKKWEIKIDSHPPANKEITKPITLRVLAQAFYRDPDRWKDILRANKSLGKSWGASTPLEKNKLFKTHKRHKLEIKQLRKGTSSSSGTGGIQAPDDE